MRRKYKEISDEEKEDLLVLYYFKQIQLNDLADIFNTKYHIVSRIISEDIIRRQAENEREQENNTEA